MSITFRDALFPVLALAISGCSSGGRVTIDGYDDAMLNGAKIVVILPDAEGRTLTNPDAFSAARGVAPVSAAEVLENELRQFLVPSIDVEYDSNTVVSYGDQPIGQMIPVSTSTDFVAGTPVAWDKLARAAREGNFDYIIAVTSVIVDTRPNQLRGTEGIRIDYALLDPARSRVMSRGEVDLAPVDLIAPPETYHRLVPALVARLPFHRVERGR